jgi:hypothetical protein
VHEYLREMCATKIAPCPAGAATQDTFRFYEALEANCLPIIPALRADGEGEGYWGMLLYGHPPNYTPPDLFNLDLIADVALRDGAQFATARASSWWQQAKRRESLTLYWDVVELTKIKPPDTPDNAITVIIPTSPTPENSLEMIQTTIASIRERLPLAEILITCDGVRPEQIDRLPEYHRYLNRLCRWANTETNVVPIMFFDHAHQSGMMRRILVGITTRHVLYVEHDCPLVGEIDFAEMLAMMERNELALLRFSHEAQILPEHEHLFLETKPNGPDPFVRTIQWSQRPHLARADWYRDVMATYFGHGSRAMIEDVMHGVVQHAAYTSRKHVEGGWEQWRLAVYAPEGDIKRSTHLDGRGGDPKYPMTFAYDTAEPPPGAPQPGTR